MDSRRQLACSACCALIAAMGCSPPLYVQPALPANQLALVMVEARAIVQDVDGQVLAYEDRPQIPRFWVAAGCRHLIVKYEESYVRVHDLNRIVMYTANFGIVVGGAVATLNTHVAAYETDTPIHFYVRAQAGMRYWITSSFDGDRFMPRVAVLNANEEREGVILPGQPCSVPALDPSLKP